MNQEAISCAALVVIAGLSAASAETPRTIQYFPPTAWETPPVVTPAPSIGAPPSDAVVLFDGSDLAEWNGASSWKVESGVAYVGDESLVSKRRFGDCQLHVEWMAPAEETRRGQGRGNSGVFLMGMYEVQVHDSYGNSAKPTGLAGAIYKQRPPMVNAVRKPGEWNAFDIYWTRPRFSDGELADPAYVTVVLNGVLVINHHALKGDTAWFRPPIYRDIGPRGPIRLQDHNSKVGYRNIWVRELVPSISRSREATYVVACYRKPDPGLMKVSPARRAWRPKDEFEA